ncbi:MAG: glycosyltransferase family 4 protein [Actinobacteria bacterium]|nr:glycosyltransferase family 4 protein [Actinomycetota bacterium]
MDSDGRGGSNTAHGGGMLRIGMICPYSLTIPGGVQHQVLGLARSLRAKGHEVRVLGPCDGPPPESFVTPLGNSFLNATNGSVAPLAPDPSASLRTIRALNDEAFDVLHIHEPLAPGPPMTSLLLKLAPIVGTFHSAGESAGYRTLQRQLTWLMKRCDIRTAVSKDALELAQRYFPGDYEVLYNGIELERYQSVEKVKKESAIFFIGRHEPRKGLEVLIQAVMQMPDDVVLWIASDGPETADLKARYGHLSKIEWLGRISDSEKYLRLRRSAVFCAPSLHGESFGVVLLEAMAAGTPVVASALPGYRNVATHDVDAVLVEPGNVQQLAAALARVIVDSRLSARLVQAGNLQADRHSMMSLATEFEVLYHRALALEAADGSVHRTPRMLKIFESRILRRSYSTMKGKNKS